MLNADLEFCSPDRIRIKHLHHNLQKTGNKRIVQVSQTGNKYRRSCSSTRQHYQTAPLALDTRGNMWLALAAQMVVTYTSFKNFRLLNAQEDAEPSQRMRRIMEANPTEQHWRQTTMSLRTKWKSRAVMVAGARWFAPGKSCTFSRPNARKPTKEKRANFFTRLATNKYMSVSFSTIPYRRERHEF